MTVSLELFERNARASAARCISAQFGWRGYLLHFLIALILPPFALGDLLFVPFFGPCLVLIALIVTLGYLRTLRHLLISLTVGGGVTLSGVILVVGAGVLKAKISVALFFVLGLCTAVMLTYIVTVVGAWWWCVERAQDALSSDGERP